MPPVRTTSGAPCPAPIESVDLTGADKENVTPLAKTVAKSAAKPAQKVKAKSPDRSHLPDHYHDIELEERFGEVPCHETASQIRIKLNKLVTSKTKIPGSNKTWTQVSLAAEMQAIAQKHHPIKNFHGHYSNDGPGLPSVRKFLKMSGGRMEGAGTEPYYYGNMLLEKLRIWHGVKKTAAQQKAQNDFPNGRVRQNPNNVHFFVHVSERTPTYNEVADMQRTADDR